jgi:pimeloyl-ACP methyl ester carboxylesterase
MKRPLASLGLMLLCILSALGATRDGAHAQSEPHPASVKLGQGLVSETIPVNGIRLHYVRGGQGPAVILIHGFPEDWSEYLAIMPRLAKRFSVIAIDLRGIGGSTAAPSGYDSDTLAEDVHQLAAALKLSHVYVVGHDIGGQVAYAFARKYPQSARGAMILDTPIPGLPGWEEALHDPSVWHIQFMQVPGLAEKLVTGRQADYFQYFYGFAKITPEAAARYERAYATPAQLHAVFEMYRAMPASAKSNGAKSGPDGLPIFLGAGAKSPFAKLIPTIARGLHAKGFAHVETGLIPDSIHYVVDDDPSGVADLIERQAAMPAPPRHD